MNRVARNRQLKKLLEQAFGKGKVSVTTGRGTAWAWAYVRINYIPRDSAEWHALYDKCHALIRAAKIRNCTL